jgi:CHAT domain-containing protein/Tfp pilus assembly protein PilF
MSRWLMVERASIARHAFVGLSVAMAASCMPQLLYSQTAPSAAAPSVTAPSTAQLTTEERAAKLAERNRLWKEAGELSSTGKLDAAVDRLATAVQLQRALFGEGTLGEAEALELVAVIQRNQLHWDKARTAESEVLAIREKVYGAADWRTIDSRLMLADLQRWSKQTPDQLAQLSKASHLLADVSQLFETGKCQEAMPKAEQALALRQQLLGDDHRMTGVAWNWLGFLHEGLHEIDQAKASHRKALEIYKKTLGDAHPDYATCLNTLAKLYWNLGEYAQAEPFYKQALETRTKALGETDSASVESLNTLAGLYLKMGDCERAEPLYKRVLEIRKKNPGEDSPDYAASLTGLAIVYLDMGAYARAELLQKQAVEIYKKALGEEHPDYAMSLGNLALVYKQMGDFARAEPLYRQALEIRKKTLGEAHPDYATSLNNLALFYESIGDFARAEPLYQQALQIRKKALGESHPDYASSLSNLAVLYNKQGDYARAESLSKQALEVYKNCSGETHRDYALGLNNLATLYINMGDYARAEPSCKQALEINAKVLGKDHPNYAKGLTTLGQVYESMGEYARAEEPTRQAVQILKKALGEAHPDYAVCVGNLGILLLELRRPAEAEKLLREAVQIQRKSLDLTAVIQSEQQQFAMVRQVRNYLDGYVTGALAAGSAPAEIYAEVAAWKGSVSAQQQLLRIRQRTLAKDPNSELGKLFSQLDSQTRKLAALTRVVPKPEEAAGLQQAIRDLSESVDSLQQQLSRLDPDFHRAWAERKTSPDDLCKVLSGDTGLVDLLEYSHFVSAAEKQKKSTWERRLVAFLLRHDKPVACVQFGPSAPIKSLVEAWRASFGRPRPGDREPPGVALRRLLWEPLATHLVGVETVLLSPDGTLAELPWGALPGDKPNTFLIEERAIAVIAIPQMLPDLVGRKTVTGPPQSLLLAGNIDYGGDPGAQSDQTQTRAAVGRTRDGQQLQFPKLDAAQSELMSIEGLYRQRVKVASEAILQGSAATEAEFRREAPQHTWLHVITHGFFAPLDPTAYTLSTAPANAADGEPPLAGIGVTLEAKDGHYYVNQLATGGAAANDGRIKIGDELVAVGNEKGDWVPNAGKDFPAIASLIRGPRGTTVRVKVQPGNKSDQEIELALVRTALRAPAVQQQQTQTVNPGLLSGLVFAGANAPPTAGKDDGILTALEVSSLDLSHVDTVVLSACETGLGQVTGGEGLLGLQRSFQVAGAKTVVASLWKVPDESTSELMQRFYENVWDRKLGKLAALREAQIELLRGHRNPARNGGNRKRGLDLVENKAAEDAPLSPFYWGAFVLSGDWR